MKCVINTKFNIGDQVYLAEIYHEYWANSKPYQIVGIHIYMNEHATKTIYHIEQNGFIDSVSERLLFATHEECARWCEEHN